MLSQDVSFPETLHFVNVIQSISSVQSLSHVQLFATPWTAARQASLSITNSQNLLKLMCIESVQIGKNVMGSQAKQLSWNCQLSHTSSSAMAFKLQMFYYYIKIVLMMMMMAKYLALNNRLTKQVSQVWLREQHTASFHLTHASMERQVGRLALLK